MQNSRVRLLILYLNVIGIVTASSEGVQDWLQRVDIQRGVAGHGASVFAEYCAACHHPKDAEGSPGLPLALMWNLSREQILAAFLKSGKAVEAKNRTLVIVTKDGPIVGIPSDLSDENVLRLRTINGLVETPRSEIIRRRLIGSMKPDALLEHMDLNEIADLLAWLESGPNVQPIEPMTEEMEVIDSPFLHEAETLPVAVTKGVAKAQEMKKFRGAAWSGNRQLSWKGGSPGDQLNLTFGVETSGLYEISAAFTRAGSYGIVRITLDDQLTNLGDQLDLYGAKVLATTRLRLGNFQLDPGPHSMTIEILGKHPKALAKYTFGLDYLLLTPLVESEKKR